MGIISYQKFKFEPAPQRAVIVVNPYSGTGKGQQVIDLLKSQQWDTHFDLFITDPDTQDAYHQAAQHALAWGADRFIVSGGDGTLMYGLTAYMQHKLDMPVSIIPSGTGNVIANDLEYPTDMEGAIRQALGSGILQQWDAGYIPDQDKYFVLRASTGYDAICVKGTNEEVKKGLGVVAYAIPAALEIFRSNPVTFRLFIDDQEPIEVSGIAAFAAVTNRIAGQADFVISDEIRPDDGLLHAGVIHPQDILKNLPGVIKNRELQGKNIVSLFPVGQQVRIEADPPQETQVEGELLGITPLIVQNVPGAVTFCTPQKLHRDRNIQPNATLDAEEV